MIEGLDFSFWQYSWKSCTSVCRNVHHHGASMNVLAPFCCFCASCQPSAIHGYVSEHFVSFKDAWTWSRHHKGACFWPQRCNVGSLTSVCAAAATFSLIITKTTPFKRMRAAGLLLLLVQTTAYFREVRCVIPRGQNAAEPDRIWTLKKPSFLWISVRLEGPGPDQVWVKSAREWTKRGVKGTRWRPSG